MKRIYAIRDKVAEAFGPLMTFPHDAPAIRAFSDVASDPQTQVGRHPDDFELMELGILDDQAAEIVSQAPARVVITGSSWRAAQVEASEVSQ